MRLGGSGPYHVPLASAAAIRAGTTVVANWSDGSPAVMWNTINGHRVAELNMFTNSSPTVFSIGWDATTNIATLVANALQFVIPPPTVTVGTVVDFSMQTNLTTSAPQTLTYTNTGTGSVTLGALNLIGAHIGDFTVTRSTGLPATIPGGGTYTAQVTFTPSGLGLRAATLSAVITGVGTATTLLRGTGI